VDVEVSLVNYWDVPMIAKIGLGWALCACTGHEWLVSPETGTGWSARRA
jgi:hypothetical protein